MKGAVGEAGASGAPKDVSELPGKRDPYSALSYLPGSEKENQPRGVDRVVLGIVEDDSDNITVGTIRLLFPLEVLVHVYLFYANTHHWDSFSRDDTEEQRPTMLTKRVSWVEGVSEAKSAHIAISIPRQKRVKVRSFLYI